MKSKTYHVFLAPDGSGETYIGSASSLEEAAHIAAEHGRGDRLGLAECDYDQARKINGGAWPSPPPNREMIREPAKWFGRGGWYCACQEAESKEITR